MARGRGNAKKDPTMKELTKLADEMNELMGLDPVLDPAADEMDEAELIQAIKDEAYNENDECEVYTTDKFSKAALKTLKALGIEPVEPPDEDPAPAKGGGGKKTTAKAKAPSKKTAPASKPSGGGRGSSKKGEDPPAPAKKTTRKMSRIDAAVEALKGRVKDLDKIAENANDIYADNGGKENLTEAKWAVGVCVSVLTGLDFAEVKNNKITING